MRLNRRKFIKRSALCAGGLSLTGLYAGTTNARDVLEGIQGFLYNMANKDGSFRPGIEPGYMGNSDTAASGIAAPAYATILCSTFGWTLPFPEKTVDFIMSCQKPDGAFYAPTGSMDPDSPLA